MCKVKSHGQGWEVAAKPHIHARSPLFLFQAHTHKQIKSFRERTSANHCPPQKPCIERLDSNRPDTPFPMFASVSRSRTTFVTAVASCRVMRAQPCVGSTATRINARLFTTQPPFSEDTEQKQLPLSPYGGRFGVPEQPMSTKSQALSQANSRRSPFSKAKEGVKSKMHDWTDEKRNLEKRKEL